jgi:TatD DNase family protein
MTQPVFVDTHCHLDELVDAMGVVNGARRDGGVLVAVTTSPTRYRYALGRFGALRGVRLALGLHPLLIERTRPRDIDAFGELLRSVRYVGEVGLDRSPEGQATWARQVALFERLLELDGARSKLWTVHTRGAEAVAVPLLIEAGVPAVLHWYTGSLAVLDKAVEAGLYFSVNPSMLTSTAGRRIVERLPRDRVLTETDAPYSKSGDTYPIATIASVVRGLAAHWSISPEAAKALVFENMMTFAALAEQRARP